MKPILKQIIEGECFICGKNCDGYVHFECAIAYSDEKEKRMREFQKNKDEINDKRVDKILNVK